MHADFKSSAGRVQCHSGGANAMPQINLFSLYCTNETDDHASEITSQKTPEKHKASSEGSSWYFQKTPAHDSLQQIFVILQDEKKVHTKAKTLRDSGQYEKPPLW